MPNRLGSLVPAMVALLAVLLAQTAMRTGAAQAQNKTSTPDLSGVWFQQEGSGVTTFAVEDPPMQPWLAAKIKTLRHDVDDPNLRCLPPGFPRVWTNPAPTEIFNVSGRVLIFHEKNHLVRQIWTDGRKHPEDLLPTWMGHSIGHWDGDTLVVDTVGLTQKSWLDSQAHLHTDALHVTERIRRVDHDTLQVDLTIDDPKAYTRPWAGRRVLKLHPDWQIMEEVCTDSEEFQEKLKEGGAYGAQ
jgi:hypothetical protein